MRRRAKLDFHFDVERGNSSVEYVCEFTVTPGEKPTGPTYDCGGTPGCGPEVDDKTVYLERLIPCEEHRYKFAGRQGCRICKRVREERPELADLVDDEELLEAAGENDDGPDPDDERDRLRDERRGL